MSEVALPSWAITYTEDELNDVVEEFDHICEVGLGERGWVCIAPSCEAQCQLWGGTWWHVPELIAYAILTGMTQRDEVTSIEPKDKAKLFVKVNRDGLTTQERIDQTLAMWDSVPHYEGWE